MTTEGNEMCRLDRIRAELDEMPNDWAYKCIVEDLTSLAEAVFDRLQGHQTDQGFVMKLEDYQAIMAKTLPLMRKGPL